MLMDAAAFVCIAVVVGAMLLLRKFTVKPGEEQQPEGKGEH